MTNLKLKNLDTNEYETFSPNESGEVVVPEGNYELTSNQLFLNNVKLLGRITVRPETFGAVGENANA